MTGGCAFDFGGLPLGLRTSVDFDRLRRDFVLFSISSPLLSLIATISGLSATVRFLRTRVVAGFLFKALSTFSSSKFGEIEIIFGVSYIEIDSSNDEKYLENI